MIGRVGQATAVLAVTQVVGWGTLYYTPAVLARTIAADLAISPSLVFGGVTTMLVVSGLVSPMLGKRFDRDGSAPYLVAGSAVAAAGLVALAFAKGAATYVFAWIVIGLAASCCLALPAMTALAQIAGPGARRALLVLMMVSGGSASLAWPMTAWLDAHLGWRSTALVFAAFHLCVCLPLHAFVLPRRGPAPPHGSPAAEALRGAVPAHGVHKAFLVMVPAFAASGVVGWGLSLHLYRLLEGLGLSPATALTLASTIGLLQITSRIGEWLLGDRVTPPGSAIFGSVLVTSSFVLLQALPASVVTATIFMVVYGIGGGLLGVARATLPLWAFGPLRYGTISGRVTPVLNLSFAAAPLLFAALTERFGMEGVLLVATVLSCVATLSYIAFAATVRRLAA